MKVTGPGFSFDASGTIGGTLTFSKWKGRNYIRTTVTPANPQSEGQVAQRAMMKFLSQNWGALSAPIKTSWYELAQAGSFSTFNAFVRENLRLWTLSRSPYQEYPQVPDATPEAAGAVNVVPGVRSITMSYSLVAPTTNWGAIIFRKLGSAPLGVKSEVRAVQLADSFNQFNFTDSPLTTGDDWYYAVQTFSAGGTNALLTQIGHAVVG